MTGRMAGSARRRRRGGDDGFTMVELLVSMFLFALVLTLISSAVLVMVHSLRKQQGQSDDLDAGRKVVTLLDHQVRYANTVRAVSTTGTATYIAWQTGDTNQPQSCTLWRFDSAAQTLAYKTWDIVTSTNGATNVSAWHPEAFNVVTIGAQPVFSTTPTSAVANTHTQASFVFGIKNGNPSTVSTNQVTLTAINSIDASASTSACGQVTS